MEKALSDLYQNLKKLTGLHRRLWEQVRLEKQLILHADLVGIEQETSEKQSLLEDIHQAERERQKLVATLAVQWKMPTKECSASAIILNIQGKDIRFAEQLRSVYQTLTLLIQRIVNQNHDNKQLIEKALKHICHMKTNLLNESHVKTATYSPEGKKVLAINTASSFSQEG